MLWGVFGFLGFDFFKESMPLSVKRARAGRLVH